MAPSNRDRDKDSGGTDSAPTPAISTMLQTALAVVAGLVLSVAIVRVVHMSFGQLTPDQGVPLAAVATSSGERATTELAR